MSRKGNGWDNAVAERFFHALKTEWIYLSVHPAALAGVHGRHRVAAPRPCVGSGTGTGWRQLAWGRTKFWEL
jgi:transposase InsO family protein